MPQLDALRCIAALMILFYHYLFEYGFGVVDFMSNGVQFFFTLSGFLITLILLEQKDANLPRLKIIGNFVVKRALRLFPIYYLVIFLFSLLSLAGLYVWDKGDWVYYYTYTTNFLFYKEGMKGVQLNHVWSLAIEEQFYLFWPWLLLFSPKRKEWVVIWAMISTSLIYKFWFGSEDFRLLTISHLDTLGIGCWLAYLQKYSPGTIDAAIKYLKWPVVIIVAHIVAYFIIGNYITNDYNVKQLVVLSCSMFLVLFASKGFSGYSGKILETKTLLYLGKISYGIYLYHKFIPYFFHLVLNQLGVTVSSWILLPVSLLLTILISHLSFRFIEQKFILAKSRFDL